MIDLHQAQQHIASKALEQIIPPAVRLGMSTSDVMGVLESVVVGVMLAVTRQEDEGKGLRLLRDGAAERLAIARPAMRKAQAQREALQRVLR